MGIITDQKEKLHCPPSKCNVLGMVLDEHVENGAVVGDPRGELHKPFPDPTVSTICGILGLRIRDQALQLQDTAGLVNSVSFSCIPAQDGAKLGCGYLEGLVRDLAFYARVSRVFVDYGLV